MTARPSPLPEKPEIRPNLAQQESQLAKGRLLPDASPMLIPYGREDVTKLSTEQ